MLCHAVHACRGGGGHGSPPMDTSGQLGRGGTSHPGKVTGVLAGKFVVQVSRVRSGQAGPDSGRMAWHWLANTVGRKRCRRHTSPAAACAWHRHACCWLLAPLPPSAAAAAAGHHWALPYDGHHRRRRALLVGSQRLGPAGAHRAGQGRRGRPHALQQRAQLPQRRVSARSSHAACRNPLRGGPGTVHERPRHCHAWRARVREIYGEHVPNFESQACRPMVLRPAVRGKQQYACMCMWGESKRRCQAASGSNACVPSTRRAGRRRSRRWPR